VQTRGFLSKQSTGDRDKEPNWMSMTTGVGCFFKGLNQPQQYRDKFNAGHAYAWSSKGTEEGEGHDCTKNDYGLTLSNSGTKLLTGDRWRRAWRVKTKSCRFVKSAGGGRGTS